MQAIYWLPSTKQDPSVKAAPDGLVLLIPRRMIEDPDLIPGAREFSDISRAELLRIAECVREARSRNSLEI